MVLNPLISVILPVYNAEKFLNESINSILEQTYTHFELIIVNDGSTDGTLDIIKSGNYGIAIANILLSLIMCFAVIYFLGMLKK